jgi:hypothetical protein
MSVFVFIFHVQVIFCFCHVLKVLAWAILMNYVNKDLWLLGPDPQICLVYPHMMDRWSPHNGVVVRLYYVKSDCGP